MDVCVLISYSNTIKYGTIDTHTITHCYYYNCYSKLNFGQGLKMIRESFGCSYLYYVCAMLIVLLRLYEWMRQFPTEGCKTVFCTPNSVRCRIWQTDSKPMPKMTITLFSDYFYFNLNVIGKKTEIFWKSYWNEMLFKIMKFLVTFCIEKLILLVCVFSSHIDNHRSDVTTNFGKCSSIWISVRIFSEQCSHWVYAKLFRLF